MVINYLEEKRKTVKEINVAKEKERLLRKKCTYTHSRERNTQTGMEKN